MATTKTMATEKAAAEAHRLRAEKQTARRRELANVQKDVQVATNKIEDLERVLATTRAKVEESNTKAGALEREVEVEDALQARRVWTIGPATAAEALALIEAPDSPIDRQAAREAIAAWAAPREAKVSDGTRSGASVLVSGWMGAIFYDPATGRILQSSVVATRAVGSDEENTGMHSWRGIDLKGREIEQRRIELERMLAANPEAVLV